jgi:hypothetical protein
MTIRQQKTMALQKQKMDKINPTVTSDFLHLRDARSQHMKKKNQLKSLTPWVEEIEVRIRFTRQGTREYRATKRKDLKSVSIKHSAEYHNQHMHVQKLSKLGKALPEMFSGNNTWQSHWASKTICSYYQWKNHNSQWFRKNTQ